MGTDFLNGILGLSGGFNYPTLMAAMTPEQIAASQYQQYLAQYQPKTLKPIPTYKWDGKPWYPLDLANRRKDWDGKIWYPLEVNHG